MSRHYPAPNDQQHDRAQRDMEAVEPGQHVERCAVRAGGQLKVEIRISMAVLICLQAHKQKAQRKSEKSPNLSCPRLFSFSAQCAQVTVTPDVSSISVLIAGSPHGPMGMNFSTIPGPAVGHSPVKSGQSILCSRSDNQGIEYTRM